jgi:hypothetical protein
VIGSLGLTRLLLPGFSVDEHAVASRRHQAVRATGGRKLDLRTLPSTATPAETRSSRADDIEHGRYNDHDEGGSLATLTDG